MVCLTLRSSMGARNLFVWLKWEAWHSSQLIFAAGEDDVNAELSPFHQLEVWIWMMFFLKQIFFCRSRWLLFVSFDNKITHPVTPVVKCKNNQPFFKHKNDASIHDHTCIVAIDNQDYFNLKSWIIASFRCNFQHYNHWKRFLALWLSEWTRCIKFL